MKRLLRNFLDLAHRETDSGEQRLEKATIVGIASACCIAGCIWAGMYLINFGYVLTTMLPLLFVVLVGAAIAYSARVRDHRLLVQAQLICITFISAFIEWSIGGVADAGLVINWSFLGPIGALMFRPVREAAYWLVIFLCLLAITVILEDKLSAHALAVSPASRKLFLAMNIGTPSIVVFAAAAYFVKRIQSFAKTDVLTGAFNRRHGTELLEGELHRLKRSGQTCGVGIIDLDHFKSINDRFGHAAGDETLKIFAACAKRCLRRGDHFARWGGEEFLLVLPSTAPGSASEVLHRIQEALGEEGAKLAYPVTFSAGLAFAKVDEPLEAVVSRADAAMYEAKTSGRNRFVIASS